jgi:hypothetical protein
MSTVTFSPLRALIQCAAGAAATVGLIALLWVGIPWPAVGHFLSGVGAAVGHGLGVVFIPVWHAIVWTGVAIGWVFGRVFAWLTFAPISFFVLIGGSVLALICLWFKLKRQDPLTMSAALQKQWKTGVQVTLKLLFLFAFVSMMAWVSGAVRESKDDYFQSAGLHLQLIAMNEASPQTNFAAQVNAANAEISDRHAIVEQLVLVDAKTRVVALSGNLNHRTCLDLGTQSEFLVQSVNGQPVHTAADLVGACSYVYMNKVVLHNKPGRWPAPASPQETSSPHEGGQAPALQADAR